MKWLSRRNQTLPPWAILLVVFVGAIQLGAAFLKGELGKLDDAVLFGMAGAVLFFMAPIGLTCNRLRNQLQVQNPAQVRMRLYMAGGILMLISIACGVAMFVFMDLGQTSVFLVLSYCSVGAMTNGYVFLALTNLISPEPAKLSRANDTNSITILTESPHSPGPSKKPPLPQPRAI